MSFIYKYALHHGDNGLTLPSDSIPLSVAGQNDVVMMWVLHQRDPNTTRLYLRNFYVANTGEDFNLGYSKFIGTVLLDNGSYVKHVFEQLDIT